MARDRSFQPRRVDVSALAEAGALHEGEFVLADLPRLAASLVADDAPSPVPWSARGERRSGPGGVPQTWLHLRAQARVRLECQRCLQPLTEPVNVDRFFRFVATEEEAERLDEESDDDVLVSSPRFDLVALLEDELILALPLVPRHDTCPEPLPIPAAETEDEDTPANPFAALAALRRPPQ